MKPCTGEQLLIDPVTGTHVEPLYEPLYEERYVKGVIYWRSCSWHRRASRLCVTDAGNRFYELLPCPSLCFLFWLSAGRDLHSLKCRTSHSVHSSAIIQRDTMCDVASPWGGVP